MDVRAELVKGLQSTPKYIPVWFRYDKQGSILNDKCLTDNPDYYFYRCEISAIKERVQEIVSKVPSPCTLVEMGSGNSEKSRMFIDALLEKQDRLTYIPVDISEEFLKETSRAVAEDYKERVDVRPIPGDYSVGIDKLSHVKGNKLIIWMGGGFQNQAYNVQIQRIATLARKMSVNDRLLHALDVTQNPDDVRKAYFDDAGTSEALYTNAIWRLNREYGSQFHESEFDLEWKFDKETAKDKLSRTAAHAVFKQNKTFNIPGLGINITVKEGEHIKLYEGEGISCKYTTEQIETLVQSGNQSIDKLFIDSEGHVALCCLQPQHPAINGGK